MPVPVTTLVFPPYTTAPTVATRVYVKAAWTDPWSLIPYLFCDQATWCCAPSIPTATLDWDIGYIRRQGLLGANWIGPLDIGRYFVGIETECHTVTGPDPFSLTSQVNRLVDTPPSYLRWYGTLEVSQEALDGIYTDQFGVGRKTGRQKLTCYGLAQMLARTPLDGHWWTETGNPTDPHYSPHAATFNERDSQGRIMGNRSGASFWEFSDKVNVDDLYWNTLAAVNYLCFYHSPQLTSDPYSSEFFRGVSLDPSAGVVLPAWDKPCIPLRGKNTWQVLNELMHRGRLLSFYLDVVPNGWGAGIDGVTLVPVSLASDDIATPDGTLVANQRQFSIRHHDDRACQASFRKNTLQAVDQFVLRGARATAIASIGLKDASSPTAGNGTLEKGWTAGQELVYEAAASTGASYTAPGVGVEEKQRQNAQSRGRDEVFEVYRRFQIPDAWSLRCLVRDGRGGSDFVDAFLLPQKQNPREVRILPTLPLKDGFNYGGCNSATSAIPPTRFSLGPHANLRPLVFFQIPDQPTRWIEASQIGRLGKEETKKTQNHRLTIQVEVPEMDKAILLQVHGQPQHAIAFAEFSKLPVDPYCGEWDWQTAVFTVAIASDLHCEGKWPPDAALAIHNTELRRVVIDVGDEYRLDYICPHTALGVHKNTGELEENIAGGFVRKDDATLRSKAMLAWTYYRQSRNVLTLSCDRPTNALHLGDLITSVGVNGSDPVGSIVTQVTLTVPHANSPTIHDAVRFEIETAHAELDFLEDILERKGERKGLAY